MRKRKDTGYWFYKLKGWKGYKSTGNRRQDRDQLGGPKGGEERITPILLWPEKVIARL